MNGEPRQSLCECNPTSVIIEVKLYKIKNKRCSHPRCMPIVGGPQRMINWRF